MVFYVNWQLGTNLCHQLCSLCIILFSTKKVRLVYKHLKPIECTTWNSNPEWSLLQMFPPTKLMTSQSLVMTLPVWKWIWPEFQHKMKMVLAWNPIYSGWSSKLGGCSIWWIPEKFILLLVWRGSTEKIVPLKIFF